MAFPIRSSLPVRFTDYEASNLGLHIFQHFRCSELLSYVPCNVLSSIAPFLPKNTRALYARDQVELETKSLLESLKFFPKLKFLSVHLLASHIDIEFFANERVRDIRGLQIYSYNWRSAEPQRNCLNDAIFTQQKWRKCSLALSHTITVAGLNEVLRQWSNGEREIIEFRLDIQRDYSREIILGGLTVPKDGTSTKLTRSEDGTTLSLNARLRYDNMHVWMTTDKTN